MYADTILRIPADDGVFGVAGLCGQSQTGPAADGETGTGGDLPETELVKAEQGASEVSVSVDKEWRYK